jgi:hypothetical protein
MAQMLVLKIKVNRIIIRVVVKDGFLVFGNMMRLNSNPTNWSSTCAAATFRYRYMGEWDSRV